MWEILSWESYFSATSRLITWFRAHSKHRHGLPICLVTTMPGYCLILKLKYKEQIKLSLIGRLDLGSITDPSWLPWKPRALLRGILIGYLFSKLHWLVEIITAEMASVRENSSQQNSQKTVFTQIFLRTFWRGYWVVPETLVEQSKTRNEHGSGTQIEYIDRTHVPNLHIISRLVSSLSNTCAQRLLGKLSCMDRNSLFCKYSTRGQHKWL
jgi:hypothetical protein